MSVDYASIPKPQPDAVFGMKDRFMKDPSPLRVNLVIGAYRDEYGKPWKLPCVKAAEKILYEANLNHEYLDIIGDPQFRKVSQQLLFGEWLSQHGNRVVSIQTLSGTGSLRICCDFIKCVNFSTELIEKGSFFQEEPFTCLTLPGQTT
eukprot:TRINITY_DN1311_c0_g1_i22.p1 TRINITY_DN1311_c0_g1~~TRINITY_DN1311_c0_g1_i22.p1  ORF type:complete len:148 (-),score=26.88 TRINITY_DN1311_c0_g1_i22:1055-1498(-)